METATQWYVDFRWVAGGRSPSLVVFIVVDAASADEARQQVIDTYEGCEIVGVSPVED